jgi:hypothetical protein
MHRAPLRLITAAGALALTLCWSPSRAAIDLAGSLDGMGTASVATVVLVPPMAVFKDPLDQRGLQNSGCHYTTSDAGAIRVLAAILTQAQVTANPVYQRADLREGAYFSLADGRKFSVLFADNRGGKLPVMGIAETTNGGQIQSAAVSARSTLSMDVRGWAKTYGGAGTGSTCDLQTPVAQDPTAPPPVPTTR